MAVSLSLWKADLWWSLPEPLFYLVFGILAALAGLAFWVYKLKQYSISQPKSITSWWHPYLRSALMIVCVSVFVWPPFLAFLAKHNEIGCLVSETRLQQDLVTLNAGNPYFLGDYYDVDNLFILLENCEGNENNCSSYQLFNRFRVHSRKYGYYYDHAKENSQDNYPSTAEELRQFAAAPPNREAIANFLAVAGKYGYFTGITPDEVESSFLKREQVFDYMHNHPKDGLQTKLQQITNSHSYAFNYENTSLLLGWVLNASLLLTAVLLVFTSLSLREFAFSAAMGVVLFLGGMFVFAILGMGGLSDRKSASLGLMLASLCSGYVLFVLKQQKFSFMGLGATTCANAFLPFATFLVYALWIIGGSLNDIEVMLSFTFSLAVHFLVFVPMLHSRYLNIKALPLAK